MSYELITIIVLPTLDCYTASRVCNIGTYYILLCTRFIINLTQVPITNIIINNNAIYKYYSYFEVDELVKYVMSIVSINYRKILIVISYIDLMYN